MSATDSRCIVCNSESMGNQFCSQQCEDDYNEVSEKLWELDKEWIDNQREPEDDPPYLDDYYAPYGPLNEDDL